jgi:hypothetical protein
VLDGIPQARAVNAANAEPMSKSRMMISV